MAAKEKEVQEASLRDLIFEKASNTGMHGVPNARRAHGWCRRIFWTALVIVGLCMMLWQITLACIKYSKNPTETTIGYNASTMLTFPAVTLCNINPIRLEAVCNQDELRHLRKLLEDYEGHFHEVGDAASATCIDTGGENLSEMERHGTSAATNGTYAARKGTRTSPNERNETNSASGGRNERNSTTGSMFEDTTRDATGDAAGGVTESTAEATAENPGVDDTEDDEEEETLNHSFASQFLSEVSELSKKDRFKFGHHLNRTLLSCSFGGKTCKKSNFKRFSNYMYGNCFTYNLGELAGLNFTLKTVNKVGPMYGLELQLYIDQANYIPGVSDAAGIRIIVHNQTYMPFPEDDGISIMPGTRTSIALQQIRDVRAEPPWGECQHYSQEENLKRNAFVNEMEHIDYTDLACKKSCYQRHVLRECGCFDSYYPFDTDNEIKAYPDLDKNVTYESCTKSSMQNSKKCLHRIERQFINNDLGCNEECPVTCQEILYRYRTSYAAWPSNAAAANVRYDISHSNTHMWDLMEDMDFDPTLTQLFVSKNVASVKIYFADLAVEMIVTQPSYLALDLISDLGGQAGLWVGVSMIALCELLELIMDICVICIKRCNKKGNRTGSVQSMAELQVHDFK